MTRAMRARAQWREIYAQTDLLGMELLGNLSEASLLIRRDWLIPKFEEFGVQIGEFDVLATLRRSAPPYELTPTALFETAMVSSGGMTSRLDRLERQGLVARRPNPEDRRGTLVGLTEKGLALMDTLVPAHIENENAALKGLTRAEQERLNSLLAKLVQSLTPAD